MWGKLQLARSFSSAVAFTHHPSSGAPPHGPSDTTVYSNKRIEVTRVKPVKWIGSSRNQTPKLVPRNIGQALYPAQREEYPSVKALKDLGPHSRSELVRIETGTGNVFADPGFANPEQERLETHLTLQSTAP